MRLFNKARKLFRLIRNSFIELVSKPLVVNASLSVQCNGEVYHGNWGDDINYFFVKELAKQKVLMFSEAPISKLFHRHNYVIIGSVIDMLLTPDSIVWGAGLITENPKIIVKPARICAVRGPKTREVLLSRGIDCPAVYGDPALLLPLYYKTQNREKKYKLGIVPHYADFDKVSSIYSNNEEVHIIRIQGYGDWTSFIEEVCQCECIASSSLHGLIISEAYGVPNVWIQNVDGLVTDTFKYEDFYASMHKTIQPIVLQNNITANELIQQCENWIQGELDLTPLLNSCPFPINKL